MVRIQSADPHSPAARAGLLSGDLLLSINGHPICDVLDYRFYLCERKLVLLYERNGVQKRAVIRKDEYADIGLQFETPLMDRKHSCKNKCVFCFIDQLPKGMRDTLYFKDDDARLSFLHGNYITLTNLDDADIERITAMHLSPMNVSVHTTDPDLRVRMMKNPRAGEVLAYLPKLAEAGIRICAQIVLCRGINDGTNLDRTLDDLSALYPSLTSVSVVPAGLTDHRDGLEPLKPFSADESAAVLDQVEAFGMRCLEKLGTRLVYPADEWFLSAGRPFPDVEYYEGFEQIENGVGMVAMLGDEFACALSELRESCPDERRMSFIREISLATGEAAYPLLSGCVRMLASLCPGIRCHTYCIENRFFGTHITVAGLLTGRDVAEQLSGKPLGEELLLPGNMLRAEGDLFLDDMTPDRLSQTLGVPVRCVPNSGESLLAALCGCNPFEEE